MGVHVKEYYTVEEFAALLGVTRQTVYQWIYDGDVQSVQTKRKGAQRIPASELDRLCRRREG